MGPPTLAQRAADMPDITIPSKQWINVNSASNIAVGTALAYQSKTKAEVLLVESATQPAEQSREGRLVQYAEEVRIRAGGPILWVYCIKPARAFVQGV